MTSTNSESREERVLILAPTGKDAHLTRSVLQRAGFTCHCCRDLIEVCQELDVGAAALLLAEEATVPGTRDCLTDWLARQPQWSDLPVLVLARPGIESAAVMRALDLLGNVSVLERPTRVAALVSMVRTALRSRRRQYQARDSLGERERAAEALRQGEERFRMLADNMAQLAWTCDASFGNATWYNQRWLDYTGMAFEDMKGWDWTKVQHPDHLERVVNRVVQSRDTGEPWEDTFPLRGKDGTYRWFLSRAIPIRDSDGRIVRWFGTNTDITELREAQQALRDADRRKDEFLAVLAHELRNPLAPICNSLNILRMSGQLDPMAERLGEMMERQVNHLVRLVDDLLEVSRITRGKIELRKELLEIAAVVRSAVETSRPLIDASRHQLALAIPAEPVTIEGDPVRLAQVIANLLNNAAKYTEPGGQIALSVAREPGQVAIAVRDTGAGIPAEMLPRVFDLFTQVDMHSNRAQGGLGIGLALVKSLVEMHGGTVEGRSEGSGRGSEFVVRLPLADVRQAIPASGGECAPAAIMPRRRVLVVDDNNDAADSLAMLLKLIGADVRVVYNGADALKASAAFQPDVVLLDIGMPEMDGHEVARRLRSEPHSESMILIALTGWGQEEDRRRSQTAGFNHHLIKPPAIETLKTLLVSLECLPSGKR